MEVKKTRPRGNVYPFAATFDTRAYDEHPKVEAWLNENFGPRGILATGEDLYTYDPGNGHLAFRQEIHLVAFMLRFGG